ncbi:MFS transporter [Pseudohaliea sp.]|uniref:AmpG family muropeptide MFS transporter n=1 Tax=Pseudohaliea sp. TaxID=2740289 RepID=UPI0032ED1B88
MVSAGGQAPGWGEALRVYARKPVLVISLLGFSAGLPFLLVFSTLTAWLRDEGVARTAIGFFAWVGLTYSLKVLWAPVVDRVRLPLLTALLGQRRGWILLGQLGIAAGLAAMSQLDPAASLLPIAAAAVLVAFSSSTQDVALDAFRIESAPDEEQGALSAGYIFGYRVALLVAGAGALYIADASGWSAAYLAMAVLVAVGVAATLWGDEPPHRGALEQQRMDSAMVDRVMGRPMHLERRAFWQRQLLGAVVCPFLEFLQRYRRFAVVVLVFVAVFRLSDIAMGVMANPFYLDLGYSKSEIASIAKLFGFFMTIAGSALCGLLVLRFGILRPLLLGAILVASTNLLFSLLALEGGAAPPPIVWLALVISADNLSGGIAATAFVAYLSSLTHRSYTATQYALFSSLMTLPGKFISGFSGWLVDSSGYPWFFVVAAALGVPAIVLVLVLMAREHRQYRDRAAPEPAP